MLPPDHPLDVPKWKLHWARDKDTIFHVNRDVLEAAADLRQRAVIAHAIATAALDDADNGATDWRGLVDALAAVDRTLTCE